MQARSAPRNLTRDNHLLYTWDEYNKYKRKGTRGCNDYNTWRAKVLRRDNYKCVKCGFDKDLQVHHINQYIDNIFLRTKVSNGVTLCKQCHGIAHPWNNKPKKYILIKAKPSVGENPICAGSPAHL